MHTEGTSSAAIEPVFVARQPIFTRSMQIWGYELLFRHTAQAREAVFSDGDVATAKVILDGFALAGKGLPDKVRTFINFSRQLVLDDIPDALPRGQVIELLEGIVLDSELLQKCTRLKKDHLLALDDYTGQPGYNSLLELADIIKVDVLNLAPQDIARQSAELQAYPGRLLAEKVEDRDMFYLTKGLGFEFFQGFFFSRPMIFEGRKLSSSEMTRLRILKELSREEIDPWRLEKIIQAEVTIAYRLLTYINSPGFNLLSKVNSVAHALKMLGANKIRQWLCVLILADFNATPRGQAVVHMAAARAFFLKYLGDKYPCRMTADAMFTVGLLSMLDALLDQPFSKILEQIPLSDEIKTALLDDAPGVSPRLEMVRCMEAGQWSDVHRITERERFDIREVARAYADALWQSQSLLVE